MTPLKLLYTIFNNNLCKVISDNYAAAAIYNRTVYLPT